MEHPIDGCTRLKAFTHVKALEDHILIRHTLKKQKEESARSNPIPVPKPAKQSKKQRHVRPKPVLVTLSTVASPAVTGRFIGKEGENLKRLEQNFKIRLQVLGSRTVSQPVQIVIKPNAGATINIETVKNVLEVEWRRCAVQQASIERSYYARLQEKNAQSSSSPQVDFTKDSRYRDDTKFRLRRAKRQLYLGRKKLRQTESSVRIQERHSGLNREGHRSAATCAVESRLKSIFNFHQPKRAKNNSKEQSWLLDEEFHLENLFISK